MGYRLRHRKLVDGGALDQRLLFRRVSLGELGASAGAGFVDAALVAVLQERAGLFLRALDRLRDIKAALRRVRVIYVADLAQDVITPLFGPAQDVVVGHVDVDIPTTPTAVRTYFSNAFVLLLFQATPPTGKSCKR